MNEFLLGLDVGTSGCKAVVFDKKGEIHGYGFSEYPIICDEPGKAEQDASYVFNKLIEVTASAISKSGARHIQAVSVSVQGDAVVLVDKTYKPLHNTLLGMDYRNTEECDFLEQQIGSREAFMRTGMRIHPINALAKVLWYKNHVPKLFEKTHKAMTYSDFVMTHLGAEPCIDLTMASRTMAMRLSDKEWDSEILRICGIEQDIFSKVKLSGEPCGKLAKHIAQQWGLDNQPLLVVGGHDQTCGAIGAGMIDEGIGVDSSGTAEVLSSAFKSPRLDDAMLNAYYPCYYHAVKGLYFTFALNHTGGIVLQWFRDNIGKAKVLEAAAQERSFYNYIEQNIKNVPSQVMALPHFNGSGTPVCDMHSKGAFVGLTLSTKIEDIFKGLLDGLTYELKINIETMQNAGINLNEIRAVGGGAKSKLWLQIKADILNKPIVTLKCKEAGCLGAAVLAAVGSGVYDSIPVAVQEMVDIEDRYFPDKESVKRYEDKYQVYKLLYNSLIEIHRRL